MRISVTDRCNFRCSYCMPKEVFGRAYKFLPRDEMLTFEEITRLARIFVDMPDKKKNRAWMKAFKKRWKEKLKQLDIWMISYRIDIE